MKLNKLVYVYYNMRLKIRHATRRSQREIEDYFNPINLDYIFEEDDPLTPWLQEREQPTLDGQDNSDWLNLDDDDDDDQDDATNRARNEQNSPSAGGSGGGGSALSPLSSNHTETNSSPDGSNPGGGQHEAGTGPSEYRHIDRDSSPFRGESGMHAFRDNEDVGDDAHLMRYRRRGRRPSGEARDNYDDHPVMHQFGDLGFGGQPGHYPLPYPMYPQGPQVPQPLYYPHPPPYYYPPPPVAYPPPPVAYPPPPTAYPPPQYDTTQYGYGLFGPPIPYGYVYQHPASSSGSGNTIDTETRTSSYRPRQLFANA